MASDRRRSAHDPAAALALSAATLVRFVPAANFYGSPPPLTVRALDNSRTAFTDGNGYVYRDPNANGGATPVAAGTNTIRTSVTLVPPDTAIDTAPASYSPGADAAFTVSGSDGAHPTTLTFEYRLDGGAWTPGNSSVTLTGLPDGRHTFEVRARGESGNPDPTPASHTWTVDTTAPTVAISGPSLGYANGSTAVTFTVIYTDANLDRATLADGDITLNVAGNAAGTVTVSGNGNTRTVTVTNITGDGTLGLSLAGGTALDLAGNRAAAAGPGATFVADTMTPAVATHAPSAARAADGPVTYQVTFADDHLLSAALTAGDVILHRTGTADGTVTVTGSGRFFLVTLTNLIGDGTLSFSLAAGPAVDFAGNRAEPAGPSTAVAADHTPPQVVALTPSAARFTDVLAGKTLTLTVSFTEPMDTARNPSVYYAAGYPRGHCSSCPAPGSTAPRTGPPTG